MTDRHVCLAGTKCRNATVTDGKKIGANTETPDSLCTACTRSVQRATQHLPRDYVALSQAIGERARAQGQRVKASPARQAPLNVAVVAAMQDIAEALDRAAEIVSDTLNCDPPEGHEPSRVSNAAVMVSTNITKLLTTDIIECWEWQSDTRCDPTCHPEKRCDDTQHLRWVERTGIDFGLRLKKLHTATSRVIGVLDKMLKLSIACAICTDYQPLYQDPETGKVLCKECGRDWSDETFGLLERVLEEREVAEKTELENRIRELEAELEQWRTAFQKAKTDPGVADAPAMKFAQVVEEMLAS